ncbi:MAG: hypothetical protein APF80_09080 [Alphaproteobacteria bacterium BRH_c36]|nr:MAG: hypothetical protein APF80_09080 [Alphaproteobacteria bacterium BRH_c36]
MWMLYDLTIVKDHYREIAPISDFKVSRRSLLASTAFLALATATAVGPTGSWAAAGVSAEQRLALIRMARDIYPHDDFLPDEPYVEVVDSILKEAESNDDTRKLVMDGLSDLEARAQKIYGSSFAAIADPNKREGVLRSIELTGFFQKFKGGLLMGLYNNKSLYPKFGYDGSSWEQGGFMDSFDKIGWL